MQAPCYANLTASHHAPAPPAMRGFTLVELVIVIVIVGIMAVFVSARFLDTRSFNAPIARDQLIAVLRNAQQSALGRPGVSVTVTPGAGGDALSLELEDSNGLIEAVTLDADAVSLSADINKTASCAVDDGDFPVTAATPLLINFGELGELETSGVTGNTGAVNSALRICINNSPVDSVCVSTSGFAYAGDCDA